MYCSALIDAESIVKLKADVTNISFCQLDKVGAAPLTHAAHSGELVRPTERKQKYENVDLSYKRIKFTLHLFLGCSEAASGGWKDARKPEGDQDRGDRPALGEPEGTDRRCQVLYEVYKM